MNFVRFYFVPSFVELNAHQKKERENRRVYLARPVHNWSPSSSSSSSAVLNIIFARCIWFWPRFSKLISFYALSFSVIHFRNPSKFCWLTDSSSRSLFSVSLVILVVCGSRIKYVSWLSALFASVANVSSVSEQTTNTSKYEQHFRINMNVPKTDLSPGNRTDNRILSSFSLHSCLSFSFLRIHLCEFTLKSKVQKWQFKHEFNQRRLHFYFVYIFCFVCAMNTFVPESI